MGRLLLVLVFLSRLISPGWSLAADRSPPPRTQGRPELVFQLWHLQSIQDAAFSHDGRFVVTVGFDQTAKFWEADTGILIRQWHGSYTAAAFSPDGKHLALAGSLAEHGIQIRDIDTGDLIRELKAPDAGPPLLYHPSGRYLILGYRDSIVQIWDLAVGEPIRTLKSPAPFAITPDGRYFIASAGDGGVQFIEFASGRRLEPPKDHSQPILCLAISPDSRLLATGHEDGTITTWRIPSGKKTASFHIPRTGDMYSVRVAAVSFSPDGHSVISHTVDGMVRLLDLATARFAVSFRGAGSADKQTHKAAIHAVKSKIFIATSFGAEAWDIQSGKRLCALKRPPAFGGSGPLALSPDNGTLAVGGDTSVSLWSLSLGKLLRPLQPPKPFLYMTAIAYDPAGQLLAAADF
ncbi:MAG TPA: hypothetical protein DD417_14300, partial [Elusimicrobia bacterium]|nr:hypothetical protein [Elusimicrobiota bacterium]